MGGGFKAGGRCTSCVKRVDSLADLEVFRHTTALPLVSHTHTYTHTMAAHRSATADTRDAPAPAPPLPSPALSLGAVRGACVCVGFWGQARFALLTRLGGMNESDVTEEEWRQVTTLTEGYSAADLKSLCTQVCVCVGVGVCAREPPPLHCAVSTRHPRTARLASGRRLEGPRPCPLGGVNPHFSLTLSRMRCRVAVQSGPLGGNPSHTEVRV